jgi:hypothetical protein
MDADVKSPARVLRAPRKAAQASPYRAIKEHASAKSAGVLAGGTTSRKERPMLRPSRSTRALPSVWDGKVPSNGKNQPEVYRDLREREDGTVFDFSPGLRAAELQTLPDGELVRWGDVFYNNWRSLENSACRKLEALSAASALYWARGGDWDALADYIERSDQITPEVGSLIAKILRGEIKKPGKPATLAKLKRDFEIVRWVHAETANRKSRSVALEGAAGKFNLAYDTIDDIFNAALTGYRKHTAKEKSIFAPIALTWRGLLAVAHEFRRRGSDSFVWVFSDVPFKGAFENLDEHLDKGVVTPDIITP